MRKQVTPRVKKVKNTLVGKTVPNNLYDNGATGRFIENELRKDGHHVDTTAIVDLPEYNVEVKSRLDTTKSSVTICSMTFDAIKKTSYKKSKVYQKTQRILVVNHNNSNVTKTSTYDFTDPYIQEKIRNSYNYSRSQLVKTGKISTKGYGYFDPIKNSNSYKFRISNKGFAGLKTMSNNSQTFNKLFEIKKKK